MTEQSELVLGEALQVRPITRNIAVERLFSLGDFKNIKFVDVIDNLPQELAFNQELVDKIRFLQMLSIDMAYQAYKRLNSNVAQREAKGEDVLAYLEEVKVTTLNELKVLMNGNFKE